MIGRLFNGGAGALSRAQDCNGGGAPPATDTCAFPRSDTSPLALAGENHCDRGEEGGSFGRGFLDASAEIWLDSATPLPLASGIFLGMLDCRI